MLVPTGAYQKNTQIKFPKEIVALYWKMRVFESIYPIYHRKSLLILKSAMKNSFNRIARKSQVMHSGLQVVTF
ncbi:MAG: hypothetical protein MH321_05000 [Leptospiraceae bacterium]|nr:hypothetical protein [Leptospiraceae bacterium]